MPSFDFIYKTFRVEHSIGELPRLQLLFDAKVSVDEGWAVYIPRLEWELKLMSTTDPESPAMTLIGDWGAYESAGPGKLFKRSGEAEVNCAILMSSPKIKQIIDVRSHEEMPRFEIRLKGTFLHYRCVGEQYQLDGIYDIPHSFAKMYYKGKEISYVTFTTDEIIKMLEQIKHYELIRIEIPVRKEEKPTNKLLAKAVDLLDTAKKDLLEGNYGDVLHSVRNALTHYIMEQPPEKKWILKEEIEKSFLENAPMKAEEEYKDLLKWIGEELRAQLRIINDVYMHKEKIKVYPRPEDAEQILFITAFLVRYLSQCLIQS